MDAVFGVFGTGDNLSTLHMAARALVVFLFTLLAVRVSGRRSFGQRTPFDMVVAILLGAVMARAIVGASPFLPTLAASFVIVLFHRIVGWLAVRYQAIDNLMNGRERILVKDGVVDNAQMHWGLVTQSDLDEALRRHGCSGTRDIRLMVLERNGGISVVVKPPRQ